MGWGLGVIAGPDFVSHLRRPAPVPGEPGCVDEPKNCWRKFFSRLPFVPQKSILCHKVIGGMYAAYYSSDVSGKE